MRKLLIASPSGGVGQTSASVNLAAAGGLSGSKTLLIGADPNSDLTVRLGLGKHTDQASLNEVGVADFGRLCRNVSANLDVLIPYEAGHNGVEELTAVVKKLTHPYFEKYVWCLIDAPPLAKQKVPQILQNADELIYVLRATMTTRNELAEFTTLAREVEQANSRMMVRGVLLTLSGVDGDEAAEGEIRQELGRKALPMSIPFDPAVPRCEQTGKPVVLQEADSLAAQGFRELAETLGVARPSSAILTASPKSAPTVAAVAVAKAAAKAPSQPKVESPPEPLRESPTVKPTPRKTFSTSLSGDFKLDNETLDRMLGMDQRKDSDAGKRPSGPRRNETRSFLDIEYDSPASGLDQPPSRVPQLDEHLSAHRPASRAAAPAPRAPSAPSVAAVSKPPSTPGSNPQLRARTAASSQPATPEPADDSWTTILWIMGIILVVMLGLGISYLGLWASETGNLPLFLAGLLGAGVTGVILVLGVLTSRRN